MLHRGARKVLALSAKRRLDLAGELVVTAALLGEPLLREVFLGDRSAELRPHIVGRRIDLAQGLLDHRIGHRALDRIDERMHAAGDDTAHPSTQGFRHCLFSPSLAGGLGRGNKAHQLR